MANAAIRVASGNFVTARPVGVIEGIDLMHTGEVRRVDPAAIRSRLEQGELTLLSPLGYSPTGEIFNLTLENVAAEAAIALKAEKLIFLMDAESIEKESFDTSEVLLPRELTVAEGKALLARLPMSPPGYRTMSGCICRLRYGLVKGVCPAFTSSVGMWMAQYYRSYSRTAG